MHVACKNRCTAANASDRGSPARTTGTGPTTAPERDCTGARLHRSEIAPERDCRQGGSRNGDLLLFALSWPASSPKGAPKVEQCRDVRLFASVSTRSTASIAVMQCLSFGPGSMSCSSVVRGRPDFGSLTSLINTAGKLPAIHPIRGVETRSTVISRPKKAFYLEAMEALFVPCIVADSRDHDCCHLRKTIRSASHRDQTIASANTASNTVRRHCLVDPK